MSDESAQSNVRKHTSAKIFGEITVSSGDEVSHARVRDTHDLELDEPDWDWIPVGKDLAPCPGDYLCVAVAGCQLEVLRQCLAKANVDEYTISINYERENTDVEIETGPMPDHTSVRVGAIHLDLTVETTGEYENRVQRCLDVCEDSCIISRSVESGFDIPLSTKLDVVATDN